MLSALVFEDNISSSLLSFLLLLLHKGNGFIFQYIIMGLCLYYWSIVTFVCSEKLVFSICWSIRNSLSVTLSLKKTQLFFIPQRPRSFQLGCLLKVCGHLIVSTTTPTNSVISDFHFYYTERNFGGFLLAMIKLYLKFSTWVEWNLR